MMVGLNYMILKFSTIILLSFAYDQAAAFQEHDGYTDTPTRIYSKLPLEDEFRYYEQAEIRIVDRTEKANAYSLDQQNLGDRITIDVTAFNRTFTLELTANKYLIHRSYEEKTIDRFGTTRYHDNASTTIKDCYYVGKVANDSYSAAAASTCSGLSAQISSGDDIYHVVPMDNSLTGRHNIVRESDSKLPVSSCGHIDGASTPSQYLRRKKRASLNWPQDLNGVTRVVELYVVNDFSQYTKENSSLSMVTSRAKEIVNFASLLFQPLNVYITLVGMETWIDGDLITVNQSHSEPTLRNFAKYRAENITRRNDHAQLFGSSEFISETIGRIRGQAYLNRMCDATLSVAIISDVLSIPGYTSATVAHEMGHSFGMQHDQLVAGCNCVGGPRRCIMFERLK